MKKIITIGAILLSAIGGLWLVSSLLVGPSDTMSPRTESFVVSLQSNGLDVLVDRVELPSPGFIVLREFIDNKPGQIIEVSPYLASGEQENIRIRLSTPLAQNGQIDISGSLPVSVDAVAVVYADDGDEGFNPIFDTPQYVNGQLLARYVATGAVAPNSVVPQKNSPPGISDTAIVVTYTDNGFEPREVTISRGETVTFVNDSSRPMWVASNVHPAHTILPTFDQFSTTPTGGTYSYTFDQRGTWEYHDHVNARQLGVVIVR